MTLSSARRRRFAPPPLLLLVVLLGSPACALSHRIEEPTALGPLELELPTNAFILTDDEVGSAISLWLTVRGPSEAVEALSARVTWVDETGATLETDVALRQVDDVTDADGVRRIRLQGSTGRTIDAVPACASGGAPADQRLDLTLELDGEELEHRIDAAELTCAVLG
jgi:hypothetical protein